MRVGAPYGKALHEALRDRKAAASQVERVKQELNAFAHQLAQETTLRRALASPLTSKIEKEDLIEAYAKKAGFDEMTARYLRVLARHNRIADIEEILTAFERIEVEANGGVLAEAVSAEPLSESEVADLARSFEKRFNKKVHFRTKTDPELLAGVKVTISGTTYDGTLRARLNRLRDSFVTYGVR